jgi:hypothetical protein
VTLKVNLKVNLAKKELTLASSLYLIDFYHYLFSQDRNPDKVDAKLKRRLDNLIDYENF